MKLLWSFWWIGVGLVVSSSPVWACATCSTVGPQAEAVNMAIIALLIVTAIMLMAFAAFFIFLWKRAKDSPPSHLMGSNLFN